MKRRVVQWLFFITCSNALLHSFCESRAFTSPGAAAHAGIKPPLMKEKQPKNVNRSQRTFNGLHEALYLRDVWKEKKVIDHNKKGKGTYGGGDLLRPRGKRSGANSLLLKPSSLLLVVLRYGILGLLSSMFLY
ncbi:uncharacterized protein LOC110411464 [Herrania umbratica]|uniref:Uncharacterized protein LOC110411464 n=1 Tax=Herrania umbratica TaxID=108875 RepID=A0A6J0ZR86_9ROSI|nr:uncharacterized protein LOC110411464 [Herrania umbratica]